MLIWKKIPQKSSISWNVDWDIIKLLLKLKCVCFAFGHSLQVNLKLELVKLIEQHEVFKQSELGLPDLACQTSIDLLFWMKPIQAESWSL